MFIPFQNEIIDLLALLTHASWFYGTFTSHGNIKTLLQIDLFSLFTVKSTTKREQC